MWILRCEDVNLWRGVNIYFPEMYGQRLLDTRKSAHRPDFPYLGIPVPDITANSKQTTQSHHRLHPQFAISASWGLICWRTGDGLCLNWRGNADRNRGGEEGRILAVHTAASIPASHDPFTHSHSCIGLLFGLHICERAFCFSPSTHVPLGTIVHGNPYVHIHALGKRLKAIYDTRTQEEKEKVKEQFLEMWAECVSQFQRPHFIIVWRGWCFQLKHVGFFWSDGITLLLFLHCCSSWPS